MKNLERVAKAIAKQAAENPGVYNYAIPDLWDNFGYAGEEKVATHDGHVLVNPYHFYYSLIRDVFLARADKKIDYSESFYTQRPIDEELKNGDWIRKSSVYSMMIRASGSFDHDRTGSLEDRNLYKLKDTGTFIKALALLPNLKKMGIDVLYLLPIAKYSLKDKKGELGSPYGVSNFNALDQGLKDPITGDATTVEQEFKAFVEAAHILGMKVIIDIIPRTNSVNSDLIVDHPDWFYWLDLADLPDYRSPMVPGLKAAIPAKKEYAPQIYASEEVLQHIRKIRKNPKQIDAKKWREMIKEYKSEGNTKEILDLVQEYFKMTIAPAFSDCINDPQPAWSDVTYFRMYLDHPESSQPFLDKLGHFEPYILFDVAKSSFNPGTQPNKPLWEMLSGIIPFYQKQFGIDGARIDMGHALPLELVSEIIRKAREINPEFTFIAEELDVVNAADSKSKGYNMIIGDGFMREPRVYDGLFNSFVYGAMNLESPLFACGETHDTPRLAARNGGETLAKMLTIFNLFVPNAIPFLNSGQEVFERQPMNTGLDCRPNESEMLDPKDPFFGKLALFDRFAFHYLHPDRWEFMNLIQDANAIRQHILPALLDKEATYPLGFSAPWDMAAGFGYRAEKKMILVIANTDVFNAKHHLVRLDNLPAKYLGSNRSIRQIFSSDKNSVWPTIEIDSYLNINLHFEKGEVKILEIE